MGKMKSGRVLFALAAVSYLGGCAAADTAINHRNLQVQTHMSESIFLDPVPERARTIYVGARNTSDHPEVELRGPLMQAIAARGYRVVNDPDVAHYMLRVNILQAGVVDARNKNGMLSAKYGEPLLAGAGGAILSNVLGGNTATTVGVGLGLALTSYLANQLVQDVTYSVIVDIQLSERPLRGGKVHQNSTSTVYNTSNSEDRRYTSGPEVSSYNHNSNGKTQNIQEESDFKQYHTRAIAYADQMNLKFEEAAPLLVGKLTSSLSNLFD